MARFFHILARSAPASPGALLGRVVCAKVPLLAGHRCWPAEGRVACASCGPWQREDGVPGVPERAGTPEPRARFLSVHREGSDVPAFCRAASRVFRKRQDCSEEYC